jgi:hypothetical protein
MSFRPLCEWLFLLGFDICGRSEKKKIQSTHIRWNLFTNHCDSNFDGVVAGNHGYYPYAFVFPHAHETAPAIIDFIMKA